MSNKVKPYQHATFNTYRMAETLSQSPLQWSTSCVLVVLVIELEGNPDISGQLGEYFKDKNRSGGGPDVLFINQHNAVVCFADPEGKPKVMLRRKRRLTRSRLHQYIFLCNYGTSRL